MTFLAVAHAEAASSAEPKTAADTADSEEQAGEAASTDAPMSIVEVRKRLRELTQRIIDGDESAETQTQFDDLGKLYSTHPDKDLTDEQARNKADVEDKLRAAKFDLEDEI